MFSNKFVSASNNYCTYENHVSAPLIRKTFFISENIKQCNIIICGLGFYKLFINGKEITKGHLAPYISNVDQIIYYDKYDLTKYIHSGKNVIGIILGNGMLNCMGGYIWDFDKAQYRSAPKVAFSIEVDNEIIEADETCKCNPSPITFDDLRSGERYDARLEVKDWASETFDDSNWQNVVKVCSPKGVKKFTDIDDIKVEKAIPYVSYKKVENGYLYDFGVNSAGIIELKINADEGQIIKLTHGEIVKDNKLNLENIILGGIKPNYTQCLIYTAKQGENIYKPHFCYMGFRYVFIEGITEDQAKNLSLNFLIMHADIKKLSDFKCSCNELNKLFENTINSTLSNFYFFPTDCPQREKNGWTGDGSFSANQMMLNLKCERNLYEWFNNIRYAQRENGQIPGVVPTSSFGYDWGNGPAWDSVLSEVPYRIYQYRNDSSLFRKNMDIIYKYLKYLESKINDKGLLEYGLGDWCQVATDKPDAFTTPLCVTDTLYGIDICDKVSKMFNNENKLFESEYTLSLKNRLVSSFREVCIDSQMFVLGRTQTGLAMAIYHNIFNEDEKPIAINNLIKLIKAKNDHFDIGVLGNRVIFRVLADNGYIDLVYKLITNDTFPSFSYQLRHGATSLWESFCEMNDNFDLKSAGNLGVLSLNHHFWGDISSFFIEYILGININYFDKENPIIIKPTFVANINFAEGYHELNNGKIEAKYNIKDNEVDYEIKVPKDTSVLFKYKDLNIKIIGPTVEHIRFQK